MSYDVLAARLIGFVRAGERACLVERRLGPEAQGRLEPLVRGRQPRLMRLAASLHRAVLDGALEDGGLGEGDVQVRHDLRCDILWVLYRHAGSTTPPAWITDIASG